MDSGVQRRLNNSPDSATANLFPRRMTNDVIVYRNRDGRAAPESGERARFFIGFPEESALFFSFLSSSSVFLSFLFFILPRRSHYHLCWHLFSKKKKTLTRYQVIGVTRDYFFCRPRIPPFPRPVIVVFPKKCIKIPFPLFVLTGFGFRRRRRRCHFYGNGNNSLPTVPVSYGLPPATTTLEIRNISKIKISI